MPRSFAVMNCAPASGPIRSRRGLFLFLGACGFCAAAACSKQSLQSTPTSCTIGDASYREQVLNPAGNCQSCDPLANPNGWSTAPDDSPCDGGICYQGTCESKQGGCVVPDAGFVSAGQINLADECQICAPLNTQVSWTNRPDGLACGLLTDGGPLVCINGSCAMCLQIGSQKMCSIGGECCSQYCQSGQCAPRGLGQHCDQNTPCDAFNGLECGLNQQCCWQPSLQQGKPCPNGMPDCCSGICCPPNQGGAALCSDQFGSCPT